MRPRVAGVLAKPNAVDYNPTVQPTGLRVQRHIVPAFLALSWIALAGASCDKKSSSKPGKTAGPNPDVVSAADRAKNKNNTDPIPGVSLEGISADNVKRFHKHANSLPSPCGKAQSLRTAAGKDSKCVRGKYAAQYLAQLLKDEAEDDVIKKVWGNLYEGKAPKVKVPVDPEAPHTGPTDGKVVIVEFFDYGCGHCKEFHPTTTELAQEFPQDLVIYYKNFVLGGFPNSKIAAQSAVAAHKQDKFKEMHQKLFEMQGAHQAKELTKYAQEIGLDMAQYNKDFAAAAVAVDKDRALGDRVNVQGTPALFINGRIYEGIKEARYLKIWVNQELAVNR